METGFTAKDDQLFDLLERYSQTKLEELSTFATKQTQILAFGANLEAELKIRAEDETLLTLVRRYSSLVNTIAFAHLRLGNVKEHKEFDWQAAQDEREIALAYFLQTRPLCQLSGDKAEEAAACLGIGRASERGIEDEQAQRHFERAVVLYHELGDIAGEAKAFAQLGQFYSTSNPQVAHQNLSKALDLYQKTGIDNAEVAGYRRLLEALNFSVKAFEMLQNPASSVNPQDLIAELPANSDDSNPYAKATTQLSGMLGQLLEQRANLEQLKAMAGQGDEGLETLLSQYEQAEPLVKVQIIRELTNNPDERARQLIFRATRDEEGFVRSTAISAVGQDPEEAAFKLLLELLAAEAETVQAAVLALGQRGDQRAVAPLLQLLAQTNDTDVLGATATALSELGDQQAVEPLLLLLSQPDEELQISVIRALGKLGDERAAVALTAFLNHSSAELRTTANYALEQLRGEAVDEEEIYELLGATEDVNAEEGQVLVRQFAGDDAASAIRRLFQLLVITSEFQAKVSVEDYALAELKQYGATASNFLVEELNSPSAEWVQQAAYLLGEFDSQTAQDNLLAVLSEGHPAFVAAVRVLAKLGDQRAVAPLADILLAPGKTNEELPEEIGFGYQGLAAEALYRLGAYDIILQALEDERVLVRNYALYAFSAGEKIDDRFLPALGKIAQNRQAKGPYGAEISNVARMLIKQIKKEQTTW